MHRLISRLRFLPQLIAGLVIACLAGLTPALAQDGCDGVAAVCSGPVHANAAVLIADGRPAVVQTDSTDHTGLLRAAADLRADLERVSGQPSVYRATADTPGIIIAGTLGRNAVIDQLVADGRLDVSGVTGEWEAYVQQVVDNPAPGVERALVIAGSDMRGAIYGVYDLSRRMGVSPWYWWADVPVTQQSDLHITAGARHEAPGVRYRGIFLNDENPALLDWVHATYGGFGHEFYGDVFELILRLRGNYIWPAMWGKAFYDDDPLNAVIADAYGIVIGTSHHEPMARAHVEWERYGEGEWDYAANPVRLREFWRQGLQRAEGHDNIITIGMRGDGDEAMSEDTAIDLLETIIDDQRTIIEHVTGEPADQAPQIWALYKEVQDYYDQGMTVPDDVTLLFADDNWGNIRRLPPLGIDREGGYGVYYHFDYVGDPRNYKWLNTVQIERTWEQMNLAWEFGARQLWIVNVGDLKPMELPISFFLDQAWNPPAMTLESMGNYTRSWAAEQFGHTHASEIAELLTRYTQYNARRKAELIEPGTFSLTEFGEADRILAEWQALADRADALRDDIPAAQDDAFVQLVWFPIQASATLNRLHIQTARNQLYVAQGRVAANALAQEVRELFARDGELERIYQQDVADGKWDHMMSQTHISYTYWQQPEIDVLPELASVTPVAGPALGLVVEGDERAWPGAEGAPALPAFQRYGAQSHYLDLFDRGDAPARFALTASADWISLSQAEGEAGPGTRIAVSIDWARAPQGRSDGVITVRGPDGFEQAVSLLAINRPDITEAGVFIEADGHVTMEAGQYARAINGSGLSWQEIPELGRTVSGITAFPVAAEAVEPGADGARLEYDIHLFEVGEVEIETVLSPSLDFRGQGGLRYAVSVDDGPPQIVNLQADDSQEAWMRHVANSVATHTTRHVIDMPGTHTVKLWLVDTGVIFQRLSVHTGPVPQTYLGPPQSERSGAP